MQRLKGGAHVRQPGQYAVITDLEDDLFISEAKVRFTVFRTFTASLSLTMFNGCQTITSLSSDFKLPVVMLEKKKKKLKQV